MSSPETEEENRRKEKYAGMGLVFGAGLGLLLGDLMFDSPIIGLATGAAIGLVLGPSLSLLNKNKNRDS